MTLLPGTKLYERLKNENRIEAFPWWKTNADWVCYRPKRMTKEELESGQEFVLKKIYSYGGLYTRLRNLWDKGIFMRKKRSRFTKSRIFFTLRVILSFDFARVWFMLKGLWYAKGATSIMWVLTAVSYHNYAYRLRKGPDV
jgi:hypothetical protein